MIRRYNTNKSFRPNRFEDYAYIQNFTAQKTFRSQKLAVKL